MAALGPLLERLGATTKGLTFQVGEEVERLRRRNGPAAVTWATGGRRWPVTSTCVRRPWRGRASPTGA
ncbi:hypothetical protein [Nonomuraea basaltis]|uniref:hypothetical protein n=1 Tax=Nonomuraea basaltis TaxID=2495887 RepID=UPI001980AFDA|nr:hypothetical protein [Nonomuraea basaltis]